MKNIWQYVLLGVVVAVGGMFVSDLAGSFFNGMGATALDVFWASVCTCVSSL